MWPNPQETVDSMTFTEEILNGKLKFLCSVTWKSVVPPLDFQIDPTLCFQFKKFLGYWRFSTYLVMFQILRLRDEIPLDPW